MSSTPTLTCIPAFLTSISPNSACNRIKTYCTNYINNATHHKVYTHAPEHLHLLSSILSPHTSYPLIALCHSNPTCLPPWIFDTCLKRKLCLPLFDTDALPFCPCGWCLNPYSDHTFQCKHICKIRVHNKICDCLSSIFTPPSPLPATSFKLQNLTLNPCSILLFLSLDLNTCPLNISFNPDPALTPN